jgi:UDP-N-acetylglucosamine 1-carboxyvinyltransferase
MAASLLADGPVELSAVPDITDVPVMAAVLTGLGVRVDHDPAAGTCRLEVVDDREVRPPRDAVTRIRASISCLGPLVARRGAAELALPGGDRIGARSIDLHLAGLDAMGAEIERSEEGIVVRAARLRGARITLDFPSVGATENLIMAATLAEGRTVIENAAREPEIADLCRMLVAMGARISGIGSPTVIVMGVERLSGVVWETCPDRIEAGTYLIAAALTGGSVRVERVRADDLTLPLRKLVDVGAEVDIDLDSGDRHPTVRPAASRRRGHAPVPRLPDRPPAADDGPAVPGGGAESLHRERVRVALLVRRPAAVDGRGHRRGRSSCDALRAVPLSRCDAVRPRRACGAAGVLAGLVADGETFVRDVHHIDRGYAHFVERLQALGADVERIGAPDA